jgi:GT2 family glycosyltransferase/ubiquinone/menaquinone biosynthesis C-methylase UbiE
MKKDSLPRISIIILNWNGINDTFECLDSLKKLDYPNFETIVVDNGSANDEADRLEKNYGGFIKIIRSKKNLGFAGGNNVAIRRILREKTSDYMLLLNNDTVVRPDFLTIMANIAQTDSRVGIVGAYNYYYRQPDRLWYGPGKVNLWIGRVDNAGVAGEKNRVIETDDVAGSSLLIKSDVVRKIGLIDEMFFCFFEETDWCMRVKKSGFKVVASPQAVILHKVGSSLPTYGRNTTYYFNRNRIIFEKRYASFWQYLAFSIYNLLYFIPLKTIQYSLISLSKRENVFFAFARGVVDGIKYTSLDRGAMNLSQEIEEKIAERFDYLKDSDIVKADAGESNFELIEITKLLKNHGKINKIIDIGCGKGKFTCKLAKQGYGVVGVDPSAELVKIAQSNHPDIEFLQASATELPFADGMFDAAICVEVLEHIPDTKKALSEMSRVVKNGGLIIVIDKNINSLHPKFLFPTRIWKAALERMNKWMYPRDFPFREKYFNTKELLSLMDREGIRAEIDYLKPLPNLKGKGGLYKTLAMIHEGVSSVIYKIFPKSYFYVAWHGKKISQNKNDQ